MITGSRSVFDLTHRDILPGPGAALDAELLNRAADSVLRLETWAQNAITLVPRESEAPALLFTVQRWIWMCPFSMPNPICGLPLSPAFLEDAGVLPRQKDSPSVPLVSLAQDVSLSVPAYTALTNNLAPNLAAIRQPQPAWVNEMRGIPFASFSVRLLGATGTDVFHLENPTYFDLGNGVSPYVSSVLRHSTPNKRTSNVPQSEFEICLLVMNWAN